MLGTCCPEHVPLDCVPQQSNIINHVFDLIVANKHGEWWDKDKPAMIYHVQYIDLSACRSDLHNIMLSDCILYSCKYMYSD